MSISSGLGTFALAVVPRCCILVHMTTTHTNLTARAAARLAADIRLDVAADNEHHAAIEGLIPQCRWCDGSGVDGDDDCGCANGRERCECGEPALRYEHFQAPVHVGGGVVALGTVREPRCLRCCQQTVGLVGPLTGWENDPDDEPGAPFDPMCVTAGGYDEPAVYGGAQ